MEDGQSLRPRRERGRRGSLSGFLLGGRQRERQRGGLGQPASGFRNPWDGTGLAPRDGPDQGNHLLLRDQGSQRSRGDMDARHELHRRRYPLAQGQPARTRALARRPGLGRQRRSRPDRRRRFGLRLGGQVEHGGGGQATRRRPPARLPDRRAERPARPTPGRRGRSSFRQRLHSRGLGRSDRLRRVETPPDGR